MAVDVARKLGIDARKLHRSGAMEFLLPFFFFFNSRPDNLKPLNVRILYAWVIRKLNGVNWQQMSDRRRAALRLFVRNVFVYVENAK